jgi:hypothetical protein
MDTKLKFFIAILLITFITSDDPECRTYKCGNLEDGVCGFKQGTEFTLQKCKGESFCNKGSEVDNKLSCFPKQAEKSYPGGSCEKAEDCIFQDCLGDKCVGREIDEECGHHGECVIGDVCRKKSAEDEKQFCLKPLKEGENCIEDEECEYTCGCHEGKCTKYFTVEDDKKVTDKRLCKSGLAVDDICKSLTNVNPVDQPCNIDSECKYINSNKTEVDPIPNSCQCGFNKDGKKYCQLGSEHQYYKDWISSTQKLLEDTSLCHTTERDNLGVCVERTKRDRTFHYRKNSHYSVNNQTIAENFPLLTNSDDCVKYVIYNNYDDSKVLPDVYQCPKYSCDSKGKNCLASQNPLNEDGSEITISLSKTCKDDEECKGLENIWTEDSVSGTCVIKDPHPDKQLVRLPGEECNEIHKCIDEGKFKSECFNGKCSGQEEDEACEDTSECLVGLYCNGSTCQPQVALNGDCNDVFDCQNHLACYKGKCIEFGKLKENEDISKNSIGLFYENPRKIFLCESGEVSFDEEETFCAVHRYADESKKNMNSDGFVKCNWGEKCYYTDGKTNEERDCECGYNAEGQGYCPLSQDNCKLFYKLIFNFRSK